MSRYNNKYNNYNRIEEPTAVKPSIKRYLTKRNIVIGLIAIFLGYSFINFAYSNINTFGMDYEYTHINTIPSYWLNAMQFLNQTKYQYNISIFRQNSTLLNDETYYTTYTYQLNYYALAIAIVSAGLLAYILMKYKRGING
jgi:hypothetical protein